MNKKIKIFFSVILFILVLEMLIRTTGIVKTYNELSGGQYNYQYIPSDNDWFHDWTPNNTVDYWKPEFHYLNTYNDLGHREINFSTFNEDSAETKIVFLGDSFTEGDGAPVDSTWTKFFDKKYKETTNTSYLSYNAGVCGSDIFYNYIMLKEKLLVSKPDIVIELLNHSDIYDVYYYGDLARFQEDGTLQSPNYLFWEPLYAKSHVFRALISVFTSYSQDLVKESTWNEDQKRAVSQIAQQIALTNEFCRLNNITYYLVYSPIPSEIVHGRHEAFNSLLPLLPNDLKLLNLYPCIFNQLNKKNIYEYSWKEDGHFNGLGYKMLGDCISEEFNRFENDSLIN